jgi:hypothetical protein
MIPFSVDEWPGYCMYAINAKWGSKPTATLCQCDGVKYILAPKECRYDQIEYILTTTLLHWGEMTEAQE